MRPATTGNSPACGSRPSRFGSTVAKFDLTLDIEESAAGYQAAFSYSTDLFDHATIERMAGHFLTLLQAAAEDPELDPVSQLPGRCSPATSCGCC